jgi:NAD(P)-dependent dehydrogenase (short-subunit alcohol dehydrogenase family)
MAQLANKTALVTGASEGIGFAIAERLIADGAKVVMLARRVEVLEAAVAKLGPRAHAIACDVTRTEDLRRAFQQADHTLGGLDAVVINAGMAGGGALADVTEEAFDQLMNLNVRSVFFTAQSALPYLRPASSIVMIGSIAAEIVVPGGSAYAASKVALTQFAKCWAEELSPRGIRVNVLAPGYTETPLFGRITATPGGAARFDHMVRQRTSLKRLGRPEEVAAAAAFLCSEDASYMTGGTIFVGGGGENW